MFLDITLKENQVKVETLRDYPIDHLRPIRLSGKTIK